MKKYFDLLPKEGSGSFYGELQETIDKGLNDSYNLAIEHSIAIVKGQIIKPILYESDVDINKELEAVIFKLKELKKG